MQVCGSLCVVTGAGSGLGRATLEHLEALGGRVAGLDLRVEAIRTERSADRYVRAVDVTSGPDLEAAFDEIERTLGTPRVLINCAGVLGSARVAKRDREGRIRPRDLAAFARVLEINLIGTFNAIRLFAARASVAPAQAHGERGVIVSTSSIAAEEALSGQTAYGASKGAVAAMTLPLARELGRFGIRVLDIKPGVFRTALYEDIPETTRASLNEDIPFPSRPGEPAEFARLIEHLITNTMLNGTGVRIDGGARMREPQVRAGDRGGR
ncbi:MAG: SDR family oxidoreductase [Proteobacteria bacterium]|nr:SDR family oxidoreductase [Pseudomonadota bacterium]